MNQSPGSVLASCSLHFICSRQRKTPLLGSDWIPIKPRSRYFWAMATVWSVDSLSTRYASTPCRKRFSRQLAIKRSSLYVARIAITRTLVPLQSLTCPEHMGRSLSRGHRFGPKSFVLPRNLIRKASGQRFLYVLPWCDQPWDPPILADEKTC